MNSDMKISSVGVSVGNAIFFDLTYCRQTLTQEMNQQTVPVLFLRRAEAIDVIENPTMKQFHEDYMDT